MLYVRRDSRRDKRLREPVCEAPGLLLRLWQVRENEGAEAMTVIKISSCEVCGCDHEAEDVIFREDTIRVRYHCDEDNLFHYYVYKIKKLKQSEWNK